jgi:hypothetical protein
MPGLIVDRVAAAIGAAALVGRATETTAGIETDGGLRAIGAIDFAGDARPGEASARCTIVFFLTSAFALIAGAIASAALLTACVAPAAARLAGWEMRAH